MELRVAPVSLHADHALHTPAVQTRLRVCSRSQDGVPHVPAEQLPEVDTHWVSVGEPTQAAVVQVAPAMGVPDNTPVALQANDALPVVGAMLSVTPKLPFAATLVAVGCVKEQALPDTVQLKT